MIQVKIEIFPYINSGTRNHVIVHVVRGNLREAASSWWIVEAATAHGFGTLDTDSCPEQYSRH